MSAEPRVHVDAREAYERAIEHAGIYLGRLGYRLLDQDR
jgi:hypothetical protein